MPPVGSPAQDTRKWARRLIGEPLMPARHFRAESTQPARACQVDTQPARRAFHGIADRRRHGQIRRVAGSTAVSSASADRRAGRHAPYLTHCKNIAGKTPPLRRTPVRRTKPRGDSKRPVRVLPLRSLERSVHGRRGGPAQCPRLMRRRCGTFSRYQPQRSVAENAQLSNFRQRARNSAKLSNN